MAVPSTVKREIHPTHPGEMIREDFMSDYSLTTASLANALGVSRQTINELLRERRSVTPTMALRLSRLFGNSPEFWLNAQHAWENFQYTDKEIHRIDDLRCNLSLLCRP